jgi:hypothetical protein
VIKARLVSADGRPILIFGLSDENIRRLQAGDPIKFELGDLGIQPSIPVAIIAGRDEETMRAQLAEWFEMPPRDEATPNREGPTDATGGSGRADP